jgi:hypothetical protein
VKILVAGDTHGNKKWIKHLCKVANAEGCSIILQLGDFGFWPHTPEGRWFLESVNKHSEENNLFFYWIDGNHENHEALKLLPKKTNGMVEIKSRIIYIPRGTRWEWYGVKFGALGGAYSIDWRYRTNFIDWWKGLEEPTLEDVKTLGSEKLDVLVTHDAPSGISALKGYSLPDFDQRGCNRVRELVELAIHNTQPDLVLHGHWHIRHTSKVRVHGREYLIEGLAADVQRDNQAFSILDLTTV